MTNAWSFVGGGQMSAGKNKKARIARAFSLIGS
jgi:hypothetical protein